MGSQKQDIVLQMERDRRGSFDLYRGFGDMNIGGSSQRRSSSDNGTADYLDKLRDDAQFSMSHYDEDDDDLPFVVHQSDVMAGSLHGRPTAKASESSKTLQVQSLL